MGKGSERTEGFKCRSGGPPLLLEDAWAALPRPESIGPSLLPANSLPCAVRGPSARTTGATASVVTEVSFSIEVDIEVVCSVTETV